MRRSPRLLDTTYLYQVTFLHKLLYHFLKLLPLFYILMLILLQSDSFPAGFSKKLQLEPLTV